MNGETPQAPPANGLPDDLPPAQSSRGRALTYEQLKNRFVYHPPQDDATIAAHEMASNLTLELADKIRKTTAPGREQSLAFTALEEVRMRWNQAIALDGAGFKANER